jgi:hypothetical protein
MIHHRDPHDATLQNMSIKQQDDSTSSMPEMERARQS